LNSKISDKDKKDWENFLSSEEKLTDKEITFSKKKINKIKSIDLHGYSLEEAHREINLFIKKSFEDRLNKLIVVTGKGLHSDNEKNPYVSKDLSILRYSVPQYIKDNNELMTMIYNIEEANIEDGGSGAFYIYLKKKL
jgi:DNA-nicking Smr family endonuclease